MTGLKPLLANYSLDKGQTKSKFIKVNEDIYLNPRQVAMVVPGKDSGTTLLLGPDTTVLATVTDSPPSDVIQVLDFYA
ncbi:MAG: hypothetical protein AB1782_05210 [Cyanobacteriota bacterium]